MKTTPYRTNRWFPLIVCLILGAVVSWVMPVVGFQSTPSATALPDAVVDTQGLNVRLGPGTTYRVITVVVENDPLVVVGRDANCQWIQVRTPKNVEGWVSRAYVELNRDCNTIVVAATPTPQSPSLAPASLSIPAEGEGTGAIETTPAASGKFVELVRPLEANLQGRQVFEWHANFALDPGQLFELVLWEPGQEPMANGFSPVSAGTATQVNVNFESAIASMRQLRAGTNYNWGVLLVTLDPYRRIQYLGGGHKFRLEHLVNATLEPADTPTDTPVPTILPRSLPLANTPTPRKPPATETPSLELRN